VQQSPQFVHSNLNPSWYHGPCVAGPSVIGSCFIGGLSDAGFVMLPDYRVAIDQVFAGAGR
jgi:hypothetical protein